MKAPSALCLVTSFVFNSCSAQSFSEAMDEVMETHGVMGMRGGASGLLEVVFYADGV